MNKIIRSIIALFLFAFSISGIIISANYFNDRNYIFAILYFIVSLLFLFVFIDSITKKDYEKIKIVYHSDIEKIERISKGDWIDLRSAEDVILKKGEFKLVNLGVSMQLPDGYEAHIVPRSSTYKNFKIIQTNHQAVIDNSYSGTNDIWKYPVYAMEDTVIHKNDRICQFRIVKSQPEVHFIETDMLNNECRGGFGSTGVN